jgi:serine/tyrosine/threonine adenylyltransferase
VGTVPLRDNPGMTTTTDRQSDLDLGLTWLNSFSRLGEDFYTPVAPQHLPEPYWIGRSGSVARALGLDDSWLESDELLEALIGNRRIAGTHPLASVYSGHQFGQWAGQLGDGRALLLGDTADGHEVQLKGAGLTPYSRMGDGRAVLRSSIREFLCSEAMHGLGIATSRALCVIGSDAPVRRETIETAAVVTRVAPSFVRFGHFEHFSYRDQHVQLKALADHVIERHYPHCRGGDNVGGNPYAALMQAVSLRTAETVAQWQAVGFCHGVMNTDNMSILGLTIDYGPFQFLDAFDPSHICNHSDTQGRYAFNRQAAVAYWNLSCLAQALLPLIGEQQAAMAALDSFRSAFPAALEKLMQAKLGIPAHSDIDPAALRTMVENILGLLAQQRIDYTIFWRRLSHSQGGRECNAVRDLFLERSGIDAWLQRYADGLASVPKEEVTELMLRTNPKFVLRNHLGEQAIRAARNKDFSQVSTLLMLLESPYGEHPGLDAYADFPPDWASGIEISCSS